MQERRPSLVVSAAVSPASSLRESGEKDASLCDSSGVDIPLSCCSCSSCNGPRSADSGAGLEEEAFSSSPSEETASEDCGNSEGGGVLDQEATGTGESVVPREQERLCGEEVQAPPPSAALHSEEAFAGNAREAAAFSLAAPCLEALEEEGNSALASAAGVTALLSAAGEESRRNSSHQTSSERIYPSCASHASASVSEWAETAEQLALQEGLLQSQKVYSPPELLSSGEAESDALRAEGEVSRPSPSSVAASLKTNSSAERSPGDSSASSSCFKTPSSASPSPILSAESTSPALESPSAEACKGLLATNNGGVCTPEKERRPPLACKRSNSAFAVEVGEGLCAVPSIAGPTRAPQKISLLSTSVSANQNLGLNVAGGNPPLSRRLPLRERPKPSLSASFASEQRTDESRRAFPESALIEGVSCTRTALLRHEAKRELSVSVRVNGLARAPAPAAWQVTPQQRALDLIMKQPTRQTGFSCARRVDTSLAQVAAPQLSVHCSGQAGDLFAAPGSLVPSLQTPQRVSRSVSESTFLVSREEREGGWLCTPRLLVRASPAAAPTPQASLGLPLRQPAASLSAWNEAALLAAPLNSQQQPQPQPPPVKSLRASLVPNLLSTGPLNQELAPRREPLPNLSATPTTALQSTATVSTAGVLAPAPTPRRAAPLTGHIHFFKENMRRREALARQRVESAGPLSGKVDACPKEAAESEKSTAAQTAALEEDEIEVGAPVAIKKMTDVPQVGDSLAFKQRASPSAESVQKPQRPSTPARARSLREELERAAALGELCAANFPAEAVHEIVEGFRVSERGAFPVYQLEEGFALSCQDTDPDWPLEMLRNRRQAKEMVEEINKLLQLARSVGGAPAESPSPVVADTPGVPDAGEIDKQDALCVEGRPASNAENSLSAA